jgi:gamma-glutamyl-gamma-aminobutyrate hydrolase PuuD
MSSIEIGYRTDGSGKGAHFDHYTLQRATAHQTCISLPAGITTNALASYISAQTTRNLPFGIRTAEGKVMPPVSLPTDRVGLLVITGHARDMEGSYDLSLRDVHEMNLLKEARNRGRPVLGICAGSWQIWTNPNFKGGYLAPVTDHAWKPMPKIRVNGLIGFNTQIHSCAVVGSSMLGSAIMNGRRHYSTWFKSRTRTSLERRQNVPQAPLSALSTIHPDAQFAVNSLHWKAPAWLPQDVAKRTALKVYKLPQKRPPGKQDRPEGSRTRLEICARSVYNSALAPSNKIPEGNSAEGFCTQNGAPVFGIQWHPEAYNPGDPSSEENKNLLEFMAKAGDFFAVKQDMLLELKKKVVPLHLESMSEESDNEISKLILKMAKMKLA